MVANDMIVEEFESKVRRWRQDVNKFRSLVEKQDDEVQRKFADDIDKALKLEAEIQEDLKNMRVADEEAYYGLKKKLEQTGETIEKALEELGKLYDYRNH